MESLSVKDEASLGIILDVSSPEFLRALSNVLQKTQRPDTEVVALVHCPLDISTLAHQSL